MADDTNNPTDKENWTGEQWKGEGQGGEPSKEAREKGAPEPHWQKQQWEGEGQDEEPDDLEPTAPTDEGENKFSGHGKNPSPQHWGEYDFGDEEDNA